MLNGDATMILGEREIVHALNEYFYHQVRDGGLSPYATVVGVRQRKDGMFIVELEGKSVDPPK